MTEEIVNQEGDGQPMPTEEACEGGSCPQCASRAEEEHIAFAFLLALMPVITLTLFGQAGLL